MHSLQTCRDLSFAWAPLLLFTGLTRAAEATRLAAASVPAFPVIFKARLCFGHEIPRQAACRLAAAPAGLTTAASGLVDVFALAPHYTNYTLLYN